MALDNDQDTVLHVACMKHVPHGMHKKTLQLLLDTPAKSLINELNNKGDTPIMVATRCVQMSLLVCNSDSGCLTVFATSCETVKMPLVSSSVFLYLSSILHTPYQVWIFRKSEVIAEA